GVSLPFSAAVAVLPALGSGAGLDLADEAFSIATSFCSLASVLAPALSPPLRAATARSVDARWDSKSRSLDRSLNCSSVTSPRLHEAKSGGLARSRAARILLTQPSDLPMACPIRASVYSFGGNVSGSRHDRRLCRASDSTLLLSGLG